MTLFQEKILSILIACINDFDHPMHWYNGLTVCHTAWLQAWHIFSPVRAQTRLLLISYVWGFCQRFDQSPYNLLSPHHVIFYYYPNFVPHQIYRQLFPLLQSSRHSWTPKFFSFDFPQVIAFSWREMALCGLWSDPLVELFHSVSKKQTCVALLCLLIKWNEMHRKTFMT